MEVQAFGTGLLFIILGLLVKKYPNLMAGYNTMSAEKKKNVDVEGLTTYARNTLLGIGLIIILAGFALSGLGYPKYFEPTLMASIIGGVIILIFGSQKYDHNK
jgi:hypothetical protein